MFTKYRTLALISIHKGCCDLMKQDKLLLNFWRTLDAAWGQEDEEDMEEEEVDDDPCVDQHDSNSDPLAILDGSVEVDPDDGSYPTPVTTLEDFYPEYSSDDDDDEDEIGETTSLVGDSQPVELAEASVSPAAPEGPSSSSLVAERRAQILEKMAALKTGVGECMKSQNLVPPFDNHNHNQNPQNHFLKDTVT